MQGSCYGLAFLARPTTLLAPVPFGLALLQGFGLTSRFPCLTVDPAGLSMLLVSPGLLAAPWTGWRDPRTGWRDPTARLLWAATVLVAVPVFLCYGGGYEQYGFRYSLDFTPLGG